MATQYISNVKTHWYSMIKKSMRKHRGKGSIYMIRQTTDLYLYYAV